MVDEFIELVSIDSAPLKERLVADALKAKLEGLGLEVMEDDAAQAIGGDAGNVIARLPGTLKGAPTLLFAVHMDRVSPGLGIRPQIRDDVIYSDGTTILASDDLAGAVQMLEAARVLQEQSIPHGDIEFLFTVSEEAGMKGVKHLDVTLLKAKAAYCLDGGGPVGAVINQAPAQSRIEVKLIGRPAHAGLSPEKGISAIQVAADAVSKMNLGRIDAETTCNIGTIKGGLATNIVPEVVEMLAEVRSRNDAKLTAQVKHMVEGFEDAASRWGAKAEINVSNSYPAMNLAADAPAVFWAMQALTSVGRTPVVQPTGGGSDANILSSKGLPSVVLSVGMEKVHSKEEYIEIKELVKGAELVLALIEQAAKTPA
jgi:tripeptide aminopeptidase